MTKPPRRARTALTAVAGALLVSLLLAGSALADSATITITDTAGHSDPAGGIPRTFTVSGTTSAPKNIYIKFRNPGPTPCAPTAGTDTGDFWDGYGEDSSYSNDTRGENANGNFSFSDVYSTSLRGTYMFCIWIAPDKSTSVTAITQLITFRSPTGTISATINPVTPQPGQPATITVNGVSEAPETVFALVRVAGTPCSQTYDADRNLGDETELFDDYNGPSKNVNGNFAIADTVTESTAGNYVLCLWLADSSSSATPVAGPQPIPFTVAAPYVPPPPKPPGQTAECKAAKQKVTAWTKKVKATKKSLLHARRKATRRRLTRRLQSQRRSLKVATAKARTICS